MLRRVAGGQYAAIPVVALAAVAFGLRLALLPTRLLVENDGPYYVALASQLLRGDWTGALNDYWSQWYPVTIALLGLFTRDPELAARLVSAVCGAALVPAVWWLANEVADPLTACLAATLTAFQHWLLVFSTLALTEMLFTLSLVIALALIVRSARRGGLGRFALAGAVTGLAILTRPEGVLLVAGLLVAGALRLAQHHSWRLVRESATRTAAELAAGLVALGLIMLPQSAGTYHIYGHLNLAWKSSVNVALGNAFTDSIQAEQAAHRLDSQGQRALVTQARQVSLGEYWLEHAGDALKRVGDNALAVWHANMAEVLSPVPWEGTVPALVVGALAALGVLAGLVGPKRGARLGLLAFAAAYACGLLSVLVHARLLVPLIPFSLYLTALGTSRVIEAIWRATIYFVSSGVRRVAGLALVLAGGVTLLWAAGASFAWASTQTDLLGIEPVAQKEAGLWLRGHAPQTARLLSHNPQTPFYFYEGWPFDRALALPWASPDDTLAYARQENVSYILLEEWMVRAGHYPVEPWLDVQQPHPGLELVKVFGAAPNRVILYQSMR